MRAIPLAVRERIIHLYEQGQETGEIARSLGYCAAAVRRVRQRFQERGTLATLTHQCGRKSLLTPARQARLQALLAQQPDATLAELGARFQRPTSTIDLWLARLGLSYKKNAARRGTGPARRGGKAPGVASQNGGAAGGEAGGRG